MRGLASLVTCAILLGLSLTASACGSSSRGSILAYSEPASSALYVDGVYMGLTPESVVGLKPGAHEITLTLRRYETYKTTVEVEPCQTITLKAQLAPLTYSPLTGYAALDLSPSGGQEGQTPFGKALGSSKKEITVAKTFTSGEIIPSDIRFPVPSITVTGSVQLQDDLAYARIIAEDASGMEHLVYSTDEMGVGAGKHAFQDACVETCEMKSVKPLIFKVELSRATITLDSIDYMGSAQVYTASAGDNAITAKKDLQLKAKLLKLNERIKRNGEGWVAGDTPVARMSYEEKKTLFLNGEVPNLYGFEAYVGGVFKLPDEGGGESSIGDGENGSSPGLSLPASFDWRKRHGENWLTPVRNQGSCGSCWAHGALGSIEGAINMRYNQHIDINLAEQDLVSCFHGYGCSGAYVSQITNLMMNYMRVNGTPDEACFPYTATNGNCSSKCASSQSRLWRTGGATIVPATIDAVKRAIVQNGSLHMIDYGWSHAITAVGYGYNGSDFYVVFKNSWGPGWGEAGYAKKVITPSQMASAYLFYAVNAPFTPPQGISHNVSCVDKDGDGYCNWGIGQKPASCPGACNQLPDFDDSNASVKAVEDCALPGDEDANGFADCGDPACPQGVVCSPGMDRFCNLLKACMPRENCTLAGDEDGNGLADCADPACPAGYACSADMSRFCNSLKSCMPRENCTAAGDEDGDGLADCADSDCPSGAYCSADRSKRCDNSSRCVSVENCQLPGDEDGNRLADCLDTASCPDATYCSDDYGKACFDLGCVGLATNITSTVDYPGGVGISGNTVLWSEYSFKDGFGVNVYLFDMASMRTTKINPGLLNVTWDLPKISGSKVAYEHSGDIYLYDIPSLSTTRLTSDPRWQNSPSISPDAVAWIDNTRNSTVYYDLASRSSREIPAVKAVPAYPAVGDGIVAWQEQSQGIFMYDLSASTLKNVTDNPNSSPPIIGGGRVYYVIFGGGVGGPTARGIYSYDPASGATRMVAAGDWLPFRFSVSGDRLAWSGNLDTRVYSGPQVLLTDLSDYSTLRLPFVGVESPLPMISSDRIVWAIGKTIYLYELQAQPAESCDTPGDEDGNGYADCQDQVCAGRYCNSGRTMYCQAGLCVPAAGRLTIDSRPPGADAFLDGVYKGRTPLAVDGVPAGSHSLSLNLSGYIPYAGTVNVVAAEAALVNVTLSAATGNLSITSNPLSASAAVNGVPKGSTPLIVSGLQPGVYVVSFSKPGYSSVNQTGVVEPGRAASVFAALEPLGGAIAVSSNPTCANVDLDGNYSGGCTPLTIGNVRPGGHLLTFRKSGYITLNKTVTVYSDRTTQAAVTLTPIYGALNLLSTPSGAVITLDGTVRGETPLTIVDVNPGYHNVTFTKTDYKPYVAKPLVYVGRTTVLNPTLVSIYGVLSVKSTPAGAEVQVNGLPQGATPVVVTGLTPGKYNVSVRMVDYLPYSATASVSAGVTTSLNPTLTYYFGNLSVSSNPAGAELRVNGLPAGKTPVLLSNMTPGKYNVTLSLSGYVDYNVPTVVASGKVTAVNAVLIAYYGNISADSIPPGASVTLNGEPAGVTPIYLSGLSPGKYNVSFDLEDYVPYKTYANVYSGRTTVLKPSLTYYFGTLNIASVPSGADVAVDGVSRGATPLVLAGIEPGIHTVNVTLATHLPYYRVVSVISGRTTVLKPTLVYYYGNLSVSSRPSGAAVYVNGESMGVTPKTLLDLTPGKYNVTLTLPDHLNYSAAAIVYSGRTTALNPTLVYYFGNLTLSSKPSGAVVYLDGKPSGVTTRAFVNLAPGSYNVTLTLQDYLNYSAAAKVYSGRTTLLAPALIYYYGKISASSKPTGAQVSVNGVPLGVTPVQTSYLPPGKYNLSFTLAGYLDYGGVATVYSGKVTPFVPTLTSYFGSIYARSTPVGANVAVDGSLKGVTPLSITGIAPGVHDLTFSKSGYRTLSRNLTVISGRTSSLGVTLSPV